MLGKVFVDNSIARSKKSQNVADEMPLAIIEIGPIFQIVAQIDFFGSPKTGFCLFVVFPDIVLSDGKEDEAVFVFFKDGFLYYLAHGFKYLKMATNPTIEV